MRSSPALAEARTPEQQHGRHDQDADRGKGGEACCIGAGEVTEQAQGKRQQKAPETAGRSDQAGHGADFVPESLGHDLKDHPIAHTQARHRRQDRRERDRKRQQQGSHADQNGEQRVESREHAEPAEAVGNEAAHRS